MIAELSIDGVFFSSLLLFAVIAFLLLLGTIHELEVRGFYRLVWHRPLFEISLFIILLWVVMIAAGPAHRILSALLTG
jgi:hypothetical protein